MTQNQLPAGFSDLEPFAAWALPTETQRNQRRLASTQEELTAFAGAMLPRTEDITKLVDGHQEPWPEPVEKLFLMLLSLAEVAPAVQRYDQPAVIDGYESSRFQADEAHMLRPRY